jgi:hypothetical protein
MLASDLLERHKKQVLVETFCNLVRYALRKTGRDGDERFSVSGLSTEALDASLSAGDNAMLFGNRVKPSLKELLERARERSLTLHFCWNTPAKHVTLKGAFELSYEPDGDLKVRLLWLDIPERVPISPKVAPVGELEPLEEAVAELLRAMEDGRLAPYQPPN